MTQSFEVALAFLKEVEREPVVEVMSGIAAAVATLMTRRMSLHPGTPQFDHAMDLLKKQIAASMVAMRDQPSRKSH